MVWVTKQSYKGSIHVCQGIIFALASNSGLSWVPEMLLIWSFFGPLLFSLKTTLPVGAQRCVALVTRLCAPKGGTQDLVFFFFGEWRLRCRRVCQGSRPPPDCLCAPKGGTQTWTWFFFFSRCRSVWQGSRPSWPIFLLTGFCLFFLLWPNFSSVLTVKLFQSIVCV